jgi:DNA invertase Pin-like site-specific DNA recombinase
MAKNIGYARVSTAEQNLDLQINELKTSGCQEVFSDKIGGVKSERPGLDKCLKKLQKGDTLTVWRLDRLGRSMNHLVSVVTALKDRGVAFKSLRDGIINTTTASGELVFNIFAALSQFEKELIKERTRAGLAAARSRGKKGGRKPILSDSPKVIIAKKMHQDTSISIKDILETLKISKATLYRYLAIYNDEQKNTEEKLIKLPSKNKKTIQRRLEC